MAVINVTEQSHLRTGSTSYTDPGDAVRIFLVQCDNKHDDDGVVLFTSHVGEDGSRIPVRREPHPTRNYLLCSGKSARQADDKGALFWEVTCNYAFIRPEIYPWDEPDVPSW
jgi:hypothetical protein